jgi:DNA-binding NarL/FixJ family response regulator
MRGVGASRLRILQLEWAIVISGFVPPLGAPENDGSGNAVQGSSPRILIVEDEYFVSLALEEAIISAGYEVVGIATEADQAIRMGAEWLPDLIMMDIRLARGSDGIQAAITLYQEHNLRCIFVSAHTDQGSRDRASEARPLGWIAKPFKPSVLVEAIRLALLDGQENN